jgi:hypothetical protein
MPTWILSVLVAFGCSFPLFSPEALSAPPPPCLPWRSTRRRTTRSRSTNPEGWNVEGAKGQALCRTPGDGIAGFISATISFWAPSRIPNFDSSRMPGGTGVALPGGGRRPLQVRSLGVEPRRNIGGRRPGFQLLQLQGTEPAIQRKHDARGHFTGGLRERLREVGGTRVTVARRRRQRRRSASGGRQAENRSTATKWHAVPAMTNRCQTKWK